MSSISKFLGQFDYKIVRVLAPKDESHASVSCVVLIHKGGQHFAAKVFAISHKNPEYALQYEAMVYQHVKSIKELKRNTINFVDYLLGEPEFCPPEFNDGTVVKIAAIITHYTLNTATFQTLLEGPLSDDLLRPILFQLIFVIATLHAHSIQHNDLRPQNILLATNWAHHIDRSYSFNQFNWRIPATNRVMVFDWDLAERAPPFLGNPILTNPAFGYTAYGLFPGQINSRLDVYRLLRTLELSDLSDAPDTDAFMTNVMGGIRNVKRRAPDLLDNAGFACHPAGTPYTPDAPLEIKTAAEILLNPYFDSFRW